MKGEGKVSKSKARQDPIFKKNKQRRKREGGKMNSLRGGDRGLFHGKKKGGGNQKPQRCWVTPMSWGEQLAQKGSKKKKGDSKCHL